MNKLQYSRRCARKFPLTLFIFAGLIATLATGTATLSAQSPTPKPESAEVTLGGYKVTSATEFGFRWRDLTGSQNKFRSDLNYKSGFRSFDTDLLPESDSGKGKAFDSLLVTVSGWGGDPTGTTRVNMEKTGIYKADLNIRRVQYFNNLLNHALNEHNQNTTHSMGDLDITIFPQSNRLRLLFGASFNNTRGPGSWTTRAYSDEFRVDSYAKVRANDFLRRSFQEKLFLLLDISLTKKRYLQFFFSP